MVALRGSLRPVIPIDVRLATADDLPALVNAFGQEEYFAHRLDRQAAGAGDLFVAWRDGRPVGDVSLIREPVPETEIRERMPDIPQISHLEVAVEYRRQGIASALLDAAERRAHRLGHGLVLLGVGAANLGARVLYDRRGYDDWGQGTVTFRWEEPGPDGQRRPDSELCHVMVKFVDPAVPPLTAWDAWAPSEAARRLAGLGAPWAVAAGWAVDLHLGRQTREHSDLEIAIPRGRFPDVRRYLRDFDLYDVGNGRARRLDRGTEPDRDNHQVWVCQPEIPAWRMDIFLEPGDEHTWVSHRDSRVRMPLARAIRHTDDGIPYLAPEIVLLSKAKHARDKDEADLEHLLARLTRPARDWLAEALDLAHPGHPWLARVAP